MNKRIKKKLYKKLKKRIMIARKNNEVISITNGNVRIKNAEGLKLRHRFSSTVLKQNGQGDKKGFLFTKITKTGWIFSCR